jgi:hypothetical protein
MPETFKGTIFLLALVLSASLMPVEKLPLASWQTALGLGFVSAVFDNIPLTALALLQGGYDWGFLAYAVGFGGSMIWFGSSAGVALASAFPEAKSVGLWLRHGWHVTVAYVIGLFVMLSDGWHPIHHTATHGGRASCDGRPLVTGMGAGANSECLFRSSSDCGRMLRKASRYAFGRRAKSASPAAVAGYLISCIIRTLLEPISRHWRTAACSSFNRPRRRRAASFCDPSGDQRRRTNSFCKAGWPRSTARTAAATEQTGRAFLAGLPDGRGTNIEQVRLALDAISEEGRRAGQRCAARQVAHEIRARARIHPIQRRRSYQGARRRCRGRGWPSASSAKLRSPC